MTNPSASLTSRLPVARNGLLASLSEDDYRNLRHHLSTVSLEPRQILHKQGERLQYVYFPNGGVVSMATILPEGQMVEVGTIGDDGIVGVEVLFGDDAVSACETIVQVPVPHDSAERIAAHDFRTALNALPGLHRAVLRYVEILYAVAARLMGCNAHHTIDERCARWLLTMHDRMHQKPFTLSHEFLAAMLGVRRQSVSVIAGHFKAAGLIQYVHGHVTILDREGLELAACDCYRAIRCLQDRVRA